MDKLIKENEHYIMIVLQLYNNYQSQITNHLIHDSTNFAIKYDRSEIRSTATNLEAAQHEKLSAAQCCMVRYGAMYSNC